MMSMPLFRHDAALLLITICHTLRYYFIAPLMLMRRFAHARHADYRPPIRRCLITFSLATRRRL